MLARGGSTLAILANFEAEHSWNDGRPGLPSIGDDRSGGIVPRLQELGIWLARPEDTVILNDSLDGEFEAYLREYSFFEGYVSVARPEGPGKPNESVAVLAERDAVLVPMGNTVQTELLASAAGIGVAAPPVDLCAHINSKIFSQALCDRLGVPRPLSVATRTLVELRTGLATLLAATDQVCVKESMGVSGRGIIKIGSGREAERLLRMLGKQHKETDRVDFVVEEWITDADDLNYQFLIDPSGQIRLLDVRRADVRKGVHQGHRTPSRLPANTIRVLEEEGTKICARLRDESGYFGIVGIDAITTPEGDVFPCLEINARLNMSTFQNRIVDEYVGSRSARFYKAQLTAESPREFSWVRERLKDSLYAPGDAGGTIIMSFGTAAGRTDRRIYLATIGESDTDAAERRDLALERLDQS